MKVYVLLKHEYITIDNESFDDVLVYTYAYAFSQERFDTFLKNEGLRYDAKQGKLYDEPGYERYEVRIEEI